jgi:hypothetical protein
MYVTYLITTRTNVPEFGGFEFSVLTRRVRKMVGLDEEKKRMKKKKGDEADVRGERIFYEFNKDEALGSTVAFPRNRKI